MKKYLFAIIGCLVLSPCMRSSAQQQTTQNEFSMSGQIRPRFEARAGDFRPLSKDENPAYLITNRFRIDIYYNRPDVLKTKLSIQQVGVWGQDAPSQGLNQSGAPLRIFEGWADLKVYKGLRTKIGRQTITLDDERLFGVSDWAAGARSHDAVSVYYEKSKLKVSSFFAFNQNYEALYGNNLNNPSGSLYNPSGSQPYKAMQTFWGEYKTSDFTKLSFLFSNVGYQYAMPGERRSPVYNQQTTGVNCFLDKSATSGILTGYYQFGDNPSGTRTSAFLLSARVSEKLPGSFSLKAGADYVSGNSYGIAVKTNKAFQTLFGTNHKFYGSMDYFYSGHMQGSVGLINTYLGAGFESSRRSEMHVTGYVFHSPSAIYRQGEKINRDLGKEMDLEFSVHITKSVDMGTGISVFFTSGSLLYLEDVGNARSLQGLGWLSLNVHPEFFSAKF